MSNIFYKIIKSNIIKYNLQKFAKCYVDVLYVFSFSSLFLNELYIHAKGVKRSVIKETYYR